MVVLCNLFGAGGAVLLLGSQRRLWTGTRQTDVEKAPECE